jgi:hemolysin activation/secretion protein
MFTVTEGQRAYIERINIRGNTRTRDYVIRREFDLAEGDAYNRALVNRAERRLKNLSFFKSVKILNEPGSAPDRVVLNVDVEEQSTGEFSVSGGYSTADGFIAEVSVAERNLLGRGLYGKVADGHRPLLQAAAPDELCVVRDGDVRRRHQARVRAARGSLSAAAVFGLSAEDHADAGIGEL